MKYEQIVQRLRAIPPETMLQIIDVGGGDGHSINNPAAYIEAGLPKELADVFTETMDSTPGDYKHTIFSNESGEALAACRGIYHLHFIETVAAALGCPRSHAWGRGFRAQHAYSEIKKQLEARIKK